MLIEGVLVYQFAKAWQSTELDAKALAKNSKAFTRAAEAQQRVKAQEEILFNKMKVNATRKNAVLNYHMQKFLEIFSVIDEYHLNRGKGIKEIEEIRSVQQRLQQTISVPEIASALARTDSQLAVQLAIHGIGGLMYKDAEQNMRLASRNNANAGVIAAQADSICIAFEGLGKQIDICTEILQKLAALDIPALNRVDKILKDNGVDESKYTDDDYDAINLCSELNILIFRIINTPLIDENNKITAESQKVIEAGKKYLEKL